PRRHAGSRAYCPSTVTRPPSDLFPYPTLFRSLLAGVGVSSVVSARSPYPATRPGDPAWRQPQVAGASGGGVQGGSLLVILLIARSEEHTSELQSRENLVCRLLLGQKNGSHGEP